MRSLAIACFALAVLPGVAGAQNLPDLLDEGREANQSYLIFTADLSVAELDYAKSRIEASTDQEAMQAELTHLKAQQSYASSLLDYYDAVIDALYGVFTSRLELEIADRTASWAREEESSVEQRVQQGLALQRDLIEARTETQSAAVSAAQAGWAVEAAYADLRDATGADPESVRLSDVGLYVVDITRDEWIDQDWDVRIADQSKAIAALTLRLLPANAATFDLKVAQTELAQATSLAMLARQAAGRSYDSLVLELESQRSVIAIDTEELGRTRALLEDAEMSYGLGLMTATDRDLTATSVMSARLALMKAQQAYLKTAVELLTATGTPASEVL